MKTNILSEIVGNDHTSLINSEGYPWRGSNADLENIKTGECYFSSPFLQFGDYDNSCIVERSNVRCFLKEFKDSPHVLQKRWAYNGESIYIDVLCEDTEIIKTLQALENYPCIDDEDCSMMEIEMEHECWESYIQRDFLNAIEKHYKADYSDADNSDLLNLYNELKETSNTYFQVEAGGNGYIDIKSLINSLPEEAPQFLKLQFWE